MPPQPAKTGRTHGGETSGGLDQTRKRGALPTPHKDCRKANRARTALFLGEIKSPPGRPRPLPRPLPLPPPGAAFPALASPAGFVLGGILS
jgi:hypothetical protein